MKAINIQVSDELKARLDDIAASDHRTIKAVIVIALEQYLAEREHQAEE